MKRKLYILIGIVVLLIILSGFSIIFAFNYENNENINRALFIYKKGNSTIYFTQRTRSDIQILNSSQIITRWISNPLCNFPCWEGITPGVTNYQDAERILSSEDLFGEVIEEKPLNEHFSYIQVGFTWIERLNYLSIKSKSGNALFDRNNGKNICIRLTLPSIKLSEIISSFGEPTYIVMLKVRAIDTPIIFPWYEKLIYIKRGVIISLPLMPSNSIAANIVVNNFVIFEPTNEGFITATNNYYSDKLQNWKGFGKYDEIKGADQITPIAGGVSCS